MKIGILAEDSNYPNLALMKISRHHKEQGNVVAWYNQFDKFDKLYISKVFSFTPNYQYCIWNVDEVVRGGTGYSSENILPKEIDKLQPDYSLYNIPNNIAYGFLSRGCPNKCSWCIVPKKEGEIKPYNDIEEIAIENRNNIILMDNNILASRDYGFKQLEKIVNRKLKIDFNQGLDARLVTNDIAELLAKIKWMKYIRFACDTSDEIVKVEQAINKLRKYGYNGHIFLYTIIQELEESYKRISYWKKDAKVKPFAQPYRPIGNSNYEPPQWQKDMARWVNMGSIYNSVDFKEYKPRGNFYCRNYFNKKQQ